MKPDRNRPLKDLLLFLRTERITWSSLVYGDVQIDGAQDLKLLESLPRPKAAEPVKSVFERYAGPLAEAPSPPGETFLPVEEDDE